MARAHEIRPGSFGRGSQGSGRSRGTRRQRQRRKEVAGPYRSQSSVPEIRAKATPREHRKVPPTPSRGKSGVGLVIPNASKTTGPDLTPDLGGLLRSTASAGSDLASILRGPASLNPDPIEAAQQLGSEWLERVKERGLDIPSPFPEGSTPDAALKTLAIGAGGGASVGKAALAIQASRQATRAATSGPQAAVRAIQAAKQRAGQAAQRAPKPVRKGARAASYPVRHHPLLSAAGAPLAAEAPPGGDLKAALEGSGRAASFLGGLGKGLRSGGIAGRAVADAAELPAHVIPSLYLTGKAGVKAAQGDSSEAEQLWQGFLDESVLPALASGDFAGAGERASAHPLYAGLELAGVGAAVGRVGGAVKRGGRAPEQRAPTRVYGDIEIPHGRYSRNAIVEGVQRMRDRKRAERDFQATPKQAAKYLQGRIDRTVWAGEGARKVAVRDAEGAMQAIGDIAGKGNADAVALAVQRMARNPDTAMADMLRYRDALVAEQTRLSGGMLRANRATVERVERALAHNDPDALVAAANEFIRRQEPVQAGLHQRGLYDPEQTERASAIGFMRFHEGAQHGRPEGASPNSAGQMLTREGAPLSTEAIRAALAKQGAEPPGFVSNRPGEMGRGAYFQPSTARPSGVGPRTTGKAVMQGLSNTDFDALTRQFIGGVTRLEQAKGFDAFGREYGLSAPGGRYFPDTATARRVADDPDTYGVALPDIPGGWVPWRVAPWPTRTAELDAARRMGKVAEADPDTPEIAPGGDEAFAQQVIERALGEGEGPVVLMPKVVTDRLRRHFDQKTPWEKTAQAVTGHWKGAILPTSPGWAAGQVGDIYAVRTPIARVSPRDILEGKGIEKIVKHELSPDEVVRVMESVIPGGFMGAQRTQPHRAYEQFIGERVEPFWRAATMVRHAPGARTIGNLYARYRDTVFDLNNRYIERTPQYGALAKHVREELGMTRRQFRKAVRDMEPAVVDFVRGFRRQDNVDRAARSVEAIYGNWHKVGPDARRFLSTWAPFWTWLRAATKFAFVTLPRDHPVLTGILAASQEMTREERQKLGLDWSFAFNPDAGSRVPGHLQGGIPLPGGGVLRVSNLTTFGFFSNILENSASMAVPQFSDGLFAAFGLDWKADRLTDKEGRPADEQTAALAALTAIGEGFVPFINVVKQVTDRGFEGLMPVRSTDPDTVDYLRSLSESRQINVPANGGGSSGTDYGEVFGGSGGSGVNYGEVFGGG